VQFLLDTHILLWAAASPKKLSKPLTALLQQTDSRLHFSAASIWEIVIKGSLGRADFQVQGRVLRRGLLDNGYTEIPITSEHALHVEILPPIHKDPFDRILVAQANVEGITLLTSDEIVARYPGPVRYV
jgi:PIN domain nuclease of toxin-antitoxin system